MIYDLIILGGGPGGYNAAERAAHSGLKVACVEKRELGGVCLNEGCIPTKTLLYSAKLLDGVAHGAKYGVTAQGLQIDHPAVIKRKNKVVKTLVAGVKSALKAAGVVVMNVEGVITGKGPEGFTVQAGNESLTAPKLLLCTGSSAAVPPIPGLKEGLESGLVLTNREALDLQQKPESLVVIGGGVIGLEMASYFNSIGCKVDVVEMLDHIAGENDRELTAILQKNYEKKGITFHLGARVTGVGKEGVTFEKEEETKTLPAEKVLLSIGRRPNTIGIGLDSISVYCERGAVVTDSHMRTNVPGVWAAGDVNGYSMLAHTAYREGEAAVADMLGQKDEMRYNSVPAVIYTNPELASVGETEETAKAKGYEAKVVKLPMRFSGRYLAENEGGDGVFKMVVDGKTHTLLGVQALANYASEFIVAAGGFIQRSLTIPEIRKIVFPHPTVCEIIREAAFQYEI